MKMLLTALTILSALASICVWGLFIITFVAWLNGGFNVLLPGFGLVVSAPAILFVLWLIGMVLLALTVLLARKIYPNLP